MSVAYRTNNTYDTRRAGAREAAEKPVTAQKRRKQANAMARGIAVLFAAVLVAAVSIGLLYMKAQVCNVQREVNEAQKQLNELQRENSQLNEKYNEAINVNTITQKASELGMTYPSGDQILYVSVSPTGDTSMKNGK